MKQLEYRSATIDDVLVLVRMRLQFLKEIGDNADQLNESALESELRQYFIKHLAKGDFVCWLALDHQTVVATGGICLNSYPPSFEALNESRAYIMNVYVLPEYRSDGIGNNIFQKLMEQALRWQGCIVYLHATPMAMKIYESFGFKLKGNEMVLRVI